METLIKGLTPFNSKVSLLFLNVQDNFRTFAQQRILRVGTGKIVV